MSELKNCETFLCKIKDTCIYAPDCSGSCRWVSDLCSACRLEHACKPPQRVTYYKEGKYYYRDVR